MEKLKIGIILLMAGILAFEFQFFLQDPPQAQIIKSQKKIELKTYTNYIEAYCVVNDLEFKTVVINQHKDNPIKNIIIKTDGDGAMSEFQKYNFIKYLQLFGFVESFDKNEIKMKVQTVF